LENIGDEEGRLRDLAPRYRYATLAQLRSEKVCSWQKRLQFTEKVALAAAEIEYSRAKIVSPLTK
jgi:hypothetical protein